MIKSIHISVVLVTFNAERKLARTLNSLCYLSDIDNLDVIVKDGGSTDSTLLILRNFAKEYNKHIIIESCPDYGIYDALNQGIEQTSDNSWILILHAGDVLIKDFSSLCLKIIQNSEINSIHAFSAIVSSPNLQPYSLYRSQLVPLHEKPTRLIHPSILVNKYIYQQMNGFQAMYKICSDLDFIFRCLNHYPVMYYDIPILVIDSSDGFSQKKQNLYQKTKEQLQITYKHELSPFRLCKNTLFILSKFIKKSLF